MVKPSSARRIRMPVATKFLGSDDGTSTTHVICPQMFWMRRIRRTLGDPTYSPKETIGRWQSRFCNLVHHLSNRLDALFDRRQLKVVP